MSAVSRNIQSSNRFISSLFNFASECRLEFSRKVNVQIFSYYFSLSTLSTTSAYYVMINTRKHAWTIEKTAMVNPID